MPKERIITGIDIGSTKIATTVAVVDDKKISVIGVSGNVPSKGIKKGFVSVDGKETVNTPAGEYYCKIVRPFREGKSLLKNSGDMVIWFTDDGQRIPVQIQIKLKFGSMLLQLKSISS